METETYSATLNSRKEKEEELSYLKDPFSSFGSVRNSYIFALIFYAPFFYLITNAFIDFWPAPLIKKNVVVPVKKFSFKVHFKDYLGQEHSQQIDYDSITYPDLGVWRFSQGKHPTLKSFDVFVTLCYFKTGYKPLKLRSLNGQPLIYFDNDPIMDDYMTSQFPDFEENFKVEIEDETQLLDLAAYNAMSGQIDLIIGKSSYIQPLNLCSVPPLTSSYPNSQEIVVKHFFINKDVTEDSVGSSKMFNKSIVTSSNDLVEYVRHLLLIGTILNQHHLIMNFDRVSLHTVGGHLKVFTDSSFSCLKSQSETNEYNTRCIRKLISTSFCEKQVLNNIFFPGQPMALFKDGLISFLKHTKLGPSILGNDLIDIDLLNNYFENPSGLGILEILDVPEHFIKLLARMFVVNIRVPSEIRQNVTVPTEFSIFTKADDVEAAIKGYLGTTYEFLHLFLIGALSPITKIAEESLSKLSSSAIPLPAVVTIDEIKTKIEECKNNYSFPLVNVSKYFCDQIQKQTYSKSESNLIKMAVSLINIDEDTKLIS